MSAETPVFIGGAGRSGTTLVVDLLGVHSQLSPIYETDFVVSLIPKLFGNDGRNRAEMEHRVRHYMESWTKTLPLRPHNKREYERYLHGPHHILFQQALVMDCLEELFEKLRANQGLSAFRHFIDQLFGSHAMADGKTRWINKTPSYVHVLPTLSQMYPSLRFIHCVRDGRDVACSVVTRPWGPSDHLGGGHWWAQNVMAGRHWGEANPSRYLEVQYEHLLRSPESTLRNVLGFVGAPDEAKEMVSHYQKGQSRLDPSRCGNWHTCFSHTEAEVFHTRYGALLEDLGYEKGSCGQAQDSTRLPR